MIGVIADPSEEDVVREFFEVFKTPWEFYHEHRCYEVVLCTKDCEFVTTANLTLFYRGSKSLWDSEQDIQIADQRSQPCTLLYEGYRIPCYGKTVTFSTHGGILSDECSGQAAAHLMCSGVRVFARIGYDLFGEVRTLLTIGQPSSQAGTPTLELHIAFLRDLITGCGVSLVEVPPVPEGHQFIACLTHDIDHPSIRKHRWDHTIVGFLYRALLGSIGSLIKGQLGFRDLLRNWLAALKLPLVYLGLAKDFWREFADRYREIEKDISSTFFVIAFKNVAGNGARGRARRLRASRYEARDIADTIQELKAVGCEIGLHGIDAWLDSPKGREEFEEIQRLAGVSEIGVRMHWLYYDQKSPAALERAGAAYDSTVGYNDAVGYRAGTTQVFKPLQVCQLLELPLHVMDTALFYPAYLRLSQKEAGTVIGRLIDNATRFGGCITINWHDRSIFPERLWISSYCELLESLRIQGAWFATASQAVAWFRKRRSVVFETDITEPNAVHAKIGSTQGDSLPRLRLRLHNARESFRQNRCDVEKYVDKPVDESPTAAVRCEAGG